MSPLRSACRDGKKFMWDGITRATAEAAAGAKAGYQSDGFEVWIEEEAGSFLVYTRRRVAETAAVSP